MSAQPNSTPDFEQAVITAQTFQQPTAPETLRAVAYIRELDAAVPDNRLRARIIRAAAYVSV